MLWNCRQSKKVRPRTPSLHLPKKQWQTRQCSPRLVHRSLQLGRASQNFPEICFPGRCQCKCVAVRLLFNLNGPNQIFFIFLFLSAVNYGLRCYFKHEFRFLTLMIWVELTSLTRESSSSSHSSIHRPLIWLSVTSCLQYKSVVKRSPTRIPVKLKFIIETNLNLKFTYLPNTIFQWNTLLLIRLT